MFLLPLFSKTHFKLLFELAVRKTIHLEVFCEFILESSLRILSYELKKEFFRALKEVLKYTL